MKTSACKNILIFIIEAPGTKRDDEIRISRDKGNINVEYKYKILADLPNKKDFESNITLTDDSLSRYLMTLMDFLYFDEEPYYQIQFSFPGLPDILISIADLQDKKVRKAVKRAAYIISSHWSHEYANSLDDDESDSSSCPQSSSDSSDGDGDSCWSSTSASS